MRKSSRCSKRKCFGTEVSWTRTMTQQFSKDPAACSWTKKRPRRLSRTWVRASLWTARGKSGLPQCNALVALMHNYCSCDQIWRNFTPLSKFQMSLVIFASLFCIWQNIEQSLVNFLCYLVNLIVISVQVLSN